MFGTWEPGEWRNLPIVASVGQVLAWCFRIERVNCIKIVHSQNRECVSQKWESRGK